MEEHLSRVRAGREEDGAIRYVDVELFDSPEYGSVYIVEGEEVALVDTGTGRNYERVLRALEQLDVGREQVGTILLTHVHLDHAGGAGPLARACPNADVYVHEAGERFLRDPDPLWAGTKEVLGERISYYREPEPIPDGRVRTVEDGDTVVAAGRELDVYHAPGHAFHQVVYHDRRSDGVFTGDAAGIYVPELGRVRHTSPPPGFDLEGCLADIDTLEALEPTALYFPHFGDQPTGELLETYRERLDSWVEEVRRVRERLDGERLEEHFADRAETRGVWREEHARGEERMNVAGVVRYLETSE
jgi:glyoxylase-like metal-dependent hydrolase (beta-lactamase superfamily II)